MGILMAGSSFSFGNDASTVCVRTAQYNVFCVPATTDNLLWDFGINEDKPFKLARVSYTTLPDPLSDEEFEALEEYAMRYIGVPYMEAGSSPAGFDCSGFVRYVLHNMEKGVNAYSCEGIIENCAIVDEAHLQKGDLVFFSGTQHKYGVSHVGIYIGDGKMIHTSMGRGVEIAEIFSEYWGSHFECYARPVSYFTYH